MHVQNAFIVYMVCNIHKVGNVCNVCMVYDANIASIATPLQSRDLALEFGKPDSPTRSVLLLMCMLKFQETTAVCCENGG